MQFPDLQSPLVVVVGPTAVGKTDISIRLARVLNGEIVSADSRLFYRSLDIGTAKPSLEERRVVPHHLIDVADPDEEWSLAVFQSKAKQTIHEIQSRGKLPFLVGGTGQYIRAVIEEWELPPQKPDYKLRAILEKLGEEIGPKELHRQLSAIDPEAAMRIEPGNLRRTIRAIEVMLKTGYRFSQLSKKRASPFSKLIIGLNRPRPELYDRIDNRINIMIRTGFIDEVRGLLQRGYSPSLTSLSAIGYRELIEYLQEKISLEEAVKEMKRLSRQYVRRQANWFKLNDPEIHWFNMDPDPLNQIVDLTGDKAKWSLPRVSEYPWIQGHSIGHL